MNTLLRRYYVEEDFFLGDLNAKTISSFKDTKRIFVCRHLGVTFTTKTGRKKQVNRLVIELVVIPSRFSFEITINIYRRYAGLFDHRERI